jgi:hypothetical protein
MYDALFSDFMNSGDTLRVYKDGTLLFSSEKDRLIPLREYLDGPSPLRQGVVVFDKIMGNAAALLSVIAGCTETYSPLGSQIAVGTLEKHGIKYHITEIVPYIQRPDSEEMCPMEKLSLGKEPEEFYKALTEIAR